MATVFEKLNRLNLIGNFISNFLANLSFGYIYNAVVGEMNPKFFALTTAASCLSSILFVQLNKKNLLYSCSRPKTKLLTHRNISYITNF